MSGAGKAIGVLTSGGDAQGDGARRRVYGWIWGFCLSSGPFGLVHCPSPRDLGIRSQPTSCGAPRLQVPVPRLRPESLAYVLQATGLGMPRPRAAWVRPAWGCVCAARRLRAHGCSFLGHTCVRTSWSAVGQVSQPRNLKGLGTLYPPRAASDSYLVCNGMGVEDEAGLPTCLRLGCFLSGGWRLRWRTVH